MTEWQHCIISLLDLVGIKKLILKGGSLGSQAMHEFHSLIQQATLTGLLHQQRGMFGTTLCFC